MSMDTPTAADVDQAARRLDGLAHRTAVMTSTALNERTGADVFIKCENFQRGGAFKFRGAYNAVSRLSDEQRSRGVVAYSSGNHAQAVALASQLLGTTAMILMPSDSPAGKLAATRGYGAQVITYDRYRDDRAALAAEVAGDRGLALIPPYEHPHVIAGQGTVAAELLDQVGAVDLLVVPVGGGGLLAGSALAAKARNPGIRIIGVEPELGDDTARSLAKGERVRIPVPRTIADGQAIDIPGELTFSINRTLVDDVVVVSDAQIVAAMRFAYERLKIVAEPSGASALAAVLSTALALEPTGGSLTDHDSVRPRPRIGLIVSGGNITADRFAELLAAHPGS